MSRPIIEVNRISKRYRLGEFNARTLRDQAEMFFRRMSRNDGPRRDLDLWALRDVSFSVEPGEVVGIIGRNGAGKSTLLKILSRITEPTNGEVRIRGRVASLLEVGTGFHPELTGRENIFLNGAVLGMARTEVKQKFDDIVAFAEIDKFLDTPVKRYSSGMYVRLAFAVAAHLDPEVLIVDEVLAVGDAAFQKKCIGKMDEVAGRGRTVLLVSHQMGLVADLCGRSMLLRDGRLQSVGPTSQVIGEYLNTASDSGGAVELSMHLNRGPQSTPCLVRAAVKDGTGQPCSMFGIDDPWTLEIDYDTGGLPSIGVGYGIYTALGQRVGGFNSCMAYQPPYSIPSTGKVVFATDALGLCPGHYLLTLSVGGARQGELYDKVENVLAFEVLGTDVYGTGWILTPEDGVHVVNARCSIEPLRVRDAAEEIR